MYKCGPPLFGPESLPSDANELLLVVHKLVAQIILYCPCEDRHKWKLQKLHEVLHFPLMIFFHHAENIDAGMGEHHLKDIFKDIACNSQQRGQDTFLSQCATRMHEKLIMTKAKHCSEVMEALCAEVPTNIARHDQPTSGNANVVSHTLPRSNVHHYSSQPYKRDQQHSMSDWQLHCQAQRYESINRDSSCHSLLAQEQLGN
jgi:hypothetical protein